MTERRVTATNQFSTVIDALQLGKKTGILTVERGQGKTFEEGTITFIHGQVVHATLGSYQEKEAATRLFSWQACRFSFMALLPEQITFHQEAASLFTRAEQGDTPVPLDGSAIQPEKVDDLHCRPFPTIDALEALDTILPALDRQGFSRTHRRLFLLIDGKRSVEELSIFLRRTPGEVMILLTDLEQAGFIQFRTAH